MLVGFGSHLRAETVPAEAVYLISARGVTALSGRSAETMAPLLDGTRSLAQVKREVSPDISAAEVDGLLARLYDANLVSFRRSLDAGKRDTAADAYWQLGGLDADQAASAIGTVTVEIVPLGGTDATAAAQACLASGLSPCEGGRPGRTAFSLVLCEDYLDPDLAAVNASHLATGRPWLLAKPTGAESWIGPVFEPGAGPCWACLAKRLEGHRQSGFLLRQALGARGPVRPPEASLPAGRAVGLQAAVLEAAKWLAGFRHDGQRALYTLDTFTLRGQHHAVPRRPQCPACGDPGLVAAQVRRPVLITSRKITARDGNGHRAARPEEVLGAHGHLVDPVTGIVDELRRDPRSPSFLHCYLSGPNRAMAAGSLPAMRAGLRAQSGGKGVSDLEARVGALCEAVERYCGSRAGDEPTVRDSLRGIGAQAIRPNACQLFDEHQFACRARWNACCAHSHRVPEPFDDRVPIDWTPVWSLVRNEQRLLPTALLYFDPGAGRQHAFVQADSNGNAAGSSIEDAILQGFFELVERDAVALWWYNRTQQPAVDTDSFGDPCITDLMAAHGRLMREVWVLDLTSDLGIPAMAAISRRTDKKAEDITLGFGAHFDPHVALRRALTELGQLLPAVVGARADGTGYGMADPHPLSWWTRATVANQPYLLPGPGPALRAADYRYSPRTDLADDISRVCALARSASLDILVLDQTRPDINMPVVKVVVPGLRHFWPRFAPGRLFDIPVRLGRIPEPTAYKQLNPIPVFM
jgi:ribosomal protein S12 methylthiotransferase accessory factor